MIDDDDAPPNENESGNANAMTTRIDFSNAYWGDDKCTEVVNAVRKTSGPVQLDLRGNRFEAQGAKQLASMLQTQHNVVALSLEWNNVGLLDEGVVALAHALEADTRLVTLDLRNNSIGPEGGRAIASALRRNQTLKKLDLRWNDIGNAGAAALVEALQLNYALLSVAITGNNCSLKHAQEIEQLLVRNRTTHEPVVRPEAVAEEAKAATASNQTDHILMQVLADKETIEVDLKAAERKASRLVRCVE